MDFFYRYAGFKYNYICIFIYFESEKWIGEFYMILLIFIFSGSGNNFITSLMFTERINDILFKIQNKFQCVWNYCFCVYLFFDDLWAKIHETTIMQIRNKKINLKKKSAHYLFKFYLLFFGWAKVNCVSIIKKVLKIIFPISKVDK